MKELLKKLQKVQSELKAPRNQYNQFGKYKYRSCEDILEAIKPILNENNLCITLNDEIICINGRYYVKSTVKLFDTESTTDQFIESCAYAREEESKKGMDASQVTGSSSSYARKYALNGLFAIDDAKDSDFTNQYTNSKPSREHHRNGGVEKNGISDEKKSEYLEKMKSAKTLEELKSAWDKIPFEYTHLLTHEKNILKDGLSKISLENKNNK